MSGDTLKEEARALAISTGSRHSQLQKLIVEGFFDSPVSSAAVAGTIRDRFGTRWKTNHVQTYMQRFMQAGIIHAIRAQGHRGNFWVLTTISREEALRMIGKKHRVRELEEQLLSVELQQSLGRDFGQELAELQVNFGRCGNCSAFLLRKILEKLIIITMSKHAKGQLLQDENRPAGWVGLKRMIDIAASEKLSGVPFLTPKTANEIKGIKFLGDTAAHNPLARVDNETILLHIPFIVTAYEELARRL